MLSVTPSDMLPKTQTAIPITLLIGTLYSTHKKTHYKQKLFFPELCEAKVSGLCVNYIIFMEFSIRSGSAKGPFLFSPLKALYIKEFFIFDDFLKYFEILDPQEVLAMVKDRRNNK